MGGGESFSVYKGYPADQCDLKTINDQANRLEPIKPATRAWRLKPLLALQICPLNGANGSVLEPGEKLSEAFVILIQSDADENTEYVVSIQMVFKDSG